jgi:aminoglycoside phosphotransferase (APT) family kinase protein
LTAVAPASPTRDPALRAWLAGQLGVARLEIADPRAPAAGGWSSETWMLTVRDGARGPAADRRVVLRLAPSGPAMFPEYDLGRQVACMRALKGARGCPVPDILAEDLAGAMIGRPLYVMDFVPGDVPSDDKPTLFEAGFLFEATAADQRRFHEAFIAAMAALHGAPRSADLTRALARTGPGATALARELAWLRGVFDWGHGPAPQPVIERALDGLDARLPHDGCEVLLWGDARPANVVVRDFAPVALLDWELATMGPPELDVFWLLEMNRMRSKGRPLPGFLTDAETLARYQDLTGHTLRDADWHVLYAATKVALLMLRHLLVRVACGDMPSDHPILTGNVATRRLAALLEAAPTAHPHASRPRTPGSAPGP